MQTAQFSGKESAVFLFERKRAAGRLNFINRHFIILAVQEMNSARKGVVQDG